MLAVVFALVQLTYALWVRTALVDAASEGARSAAMAEGDLNLGELRAREVAALSVGPDFLESVSTQLRTTGGRDLVVVTMTAPTPILGMWGPGGTLEASGRAVVE